ncbi:ribbon-helix-helix protein, CopG family [Xylanimonas ulmi]|uniref:Ribbon-helix-helix CopG family protein n=1 Tax=Xylanimonas ulmi TaxID=228973 RepID=A0A4Q7LYS2_9MICO|nr:ribbon-helix-helix protein, CopG family [Xylanibacterium ulmi]RZS60034.1 ribbon-helix-helix CopG family protein [Xylanibacterium ulmi]
MAMTLRLTPAEDAALERAAQRRGISKQEAARDAVRRYAEDDEQFAALVAKGIDRYKDALDRLAQGA